MIDLEHTSTVYFIGIGGIGMSALARYFLLRGVAVSGYDRAPTALTGQLIKEGIPVHFEENIQLIPKQPDLVIYTPAVPADHIELQYYRDKGFPMKKRAEILGLVSDKYKTIAVAGTHGKTTTSTLIAHILHAAKKDYLAFLGGISKNYGSNFLFSEETIFSPGNRSNPVYCVAEADEYDRSFLQLTPEIAIVTSADPDHLDIYGHADNLKRTFEKFTSRIKEGGHLILKQGVSIAPVHKNVYAQYSYSVNHKAAFYPKNVRLAGDLFHFDLVTPGGVLEDLAPGIPGMFNLENAIAALAVGYLTGIDEKTLREALLSYQGVQRRFDFRIRRPDLVYIDDYAHHPVELRACITAARSLYPEKKITGIFQPHLFSRTRDLADDFARSLDLLDELYLLDIYPAREMPIPGVDSGMLLERIHLQNKKRVTKAEVISILTIEKPEVLLTLGAGDIDGLVKPITEALNEP
ncbi:MAG: UDP-N-acetylmuramate--L-alanine ligase [Bacteroidales bacterium]|nr:UDP-N-acetylmuramate--L-alanine ligase [Bacteroidales bacterium]